jgi:hypothetical protein
MVAGVVTLYCAAMAVAVAVTRVEARQLWLFGLLLACGAVSVELTRRAGQTGGVVRDVYAIWDLPAALLLPPMYVLLVPIPRMVLTQFRIRQTILHRRAYSAAALGLSYAAASVVFHAAVPQLGGGTGAGMTAMLWTLLVVGCGLLRLVLNDGLVLAAVKGSAPQTRLRSEITGSEAVYGSSAELALGTLVTFVAAHVALAAVLALPLVISLQRSLRHSQLLAEASVDAKTGLLNDRTWRQTGPRTRSRGRPGLGSRWRWESLTSTTSRRSTTPTGIPRVTRCCPPWPRRSGPSCASVTSLAAPAARSSRSSCPTPRRRRRWR